MCGATQVWAGTKMNERPKLVVGIVVDQMRWDYLPRYYDQFGDDGFKRLIEEGFSCDNCLINYLPTVTSIGHTSAYTGTTPAFHGICGNDYPMQKKGQSFEVMRKNAHMRHPRNCLPAQSATSCACTPTSVQR